MLGGAAPRRSSWYNDFFTVLVIAEENLWRSEAKIRLTEIWP